MAIRANIDSFGVDPDGTTFVNVTLTDDVTFKKPFPYRLNPFNLNDLKTRVRSDASNVKTPEDPKLSLSLGTFDYSVPPPPPPDPPTDEEKARAKFFVDRNKLRQMKIAVSEGFMTALDQEYVDQVALVAGEWKAAYLLFL